MTNRELRCGQRTLVFDRPRIMGILNVTPDSFSDGGCHASVQAAAIHARDMVEAGADIIDIGGESTRPGATPVTLAEELDRVLPVIERLAAELDVVLSIDTSRPEVITAAAAAGAGLLNDVRALTADGALAAAAACGLPVCLMHMRGEPGDMQRSPRYDDVVADVVAFLRERMSACTAAGIPAGRVLVDPGFGFGKTLEHNLSLLRGLDRLAVLAPVLIGVSRKGMIGALSARARSVAPKGDEKDMGNDADRNEVVSEGDIARERLQGSIVAALYAVRRGAAIVRVHDVRETALALAVQHGIEHV